MTQQQCTHCNQRPTGEQYYLCDTCLHTLEVALGNIGAGARQVDDMRSHLHGRRYDLPRGSGGSKNTPLGMDLRFDIVNRDDDGRVTSGPATALEQDARKILGRWIHRCRTTWAGISSPAPTVPAMAGWLAGRRRAIASQPWSVQLAVEVLELERRFKRLLEVGPEPIFAGLCLVCGIFGERVALYGHRGDAHLECPQCGDRIDAVKRWDTMMEDLDHRLCTAAEIAKLASYFGLVDDRDSVRKRINQWSSRDLIEAVSVNPDGEPMFRFGEIARRLATADSTRRIAAS